jgi:hypothetical protein
LLVAVAVGRTPSEVTSITGVAAIYGPVMGVARDVATNAFAGATEAVMTPLTDAVLVIKHVPGSVKEANVTT